MSIKMNVTTTIRMSPMDRRDDYDSQLFMDRRASTGMVANYESSQECATRSSIGLSSAQRQLRQLTQWDVFRRFAAIRSGGRYRRGNANTSVAR